MTAKPIADRNTYPTHRRGATLTALTLDADQAQLARKLAVEAARLGLKHKAALHYTEGPQRWQGIDNGCDAARGDYPKEADCSAFVTWCLWNGLFLPFNMADIVNGEDWTAGYTGTLATHGKKIAQAAHAQPADVVLYGERAPYLHAAIVDHLDGNGHPVVISFGEESGPHELAYNYRGDVGEIRRYITHK